MIVIQKSNVESPLKRQHQKRCKCAHCCESLDLTIYQQPSQKRIVNINYNYIGSNIEGLFYFSMPSIIFKIWSRKNVLFKIKTGFLIENKIFSVPLGNVQYDLGVCMGNARLKIHPRTGREKYAKKMIDNFWQSEFNLGSISQILQGSESEKPKWLIPIANPITWARKTKINKKWIPTAKDLKYYSTYEEFISPKAL